MFPSIMCDYIRGMIIVTALLLGSAQCPYTHWSVNAPTVEKPTYHIYERRTLSEFNNEIATVVDVAGFNDCIYACPLADASCSYMIVSKTSAGYSCHIYTRPLPVSNLIISEKYSPSTIYLITKEKLPCSGFCRKVKGLCDDRCRCMDGCGEDALPYSCECRLADVAVQKDCTGYRKLGFEKSGVFFINPDGGEKIKVICEMKSDGSAAVVMLRRFTPTKHYNRVEKFTESGFGGPSENYVWLALDSISRITAAAPQMLRIAATDLNGSHYIAKWHSFSVSDKNSDYRVQAFTYDNNGNRLYNLFADRVTEPWVEKINNRLALFWKDRYLMEKSPTCCVNIWLPDGEYARITLSLEAAAVRRVYGEASISPSDNSYFMGAHLALDNTTFQKYASGSCSYSSLAVGLPNDSIRYWHLDMKESHRIEFVELLATVGMDHFSQNFKLSIGDIEKGMDQNPMCGPMSGGDHVMYACKDDKLMGRYLSLFIYVPAGSSSYSLATLAICEVLVYTLV